MMYVFGCDNCCFFRVLPVSMEASDLAQVNREEKVSIGHYE